MTLPHGPLDWLALALGLLIGYGLVWLAYRWEAFWAKRDDRHSGPQS